MVEVLVAMALVATSAVGVAELFAVSSRVVQMSRVDTVATLAAQSKMAQLRSRTWAFDAASGLPVGDPELAWSPASTLMANVAGYVDFVDGDGQVVGDGPDAPARAVYQRRWSVQPLPTDPASTLVVQVVAAKVTRPDARDAHLVALMARTSR